MNRRHAAFAAVAILFVCASAASAQEPDVLDAGIRAYTERGNPRETIRLIGSALDAGSVPPALTPRAHVYMAHSFLALGDTVSALPHVQRALAAEPCLMPEPGFTPPSWGALYQRYRPSGVSCRSKAFTATLQSIVIPGWGQRSVGRSTASTYFFASTALSAAAAFYFNGSSDDDYLAYQTSTDPTAVAGLYDDANQARAYAMILGGVAGALYVWNVLDAAIGGVSHDRGLARVRSLSFVPVVVPSTSGATVVVHIPLNGRE